MINTILEGLMFLFHQPQLGKEKARKKVEKKLLVNMSRFSTRSELNP